MARNINILFISLMLGIFLISQVSTHYCSKNSVLITNKACLHNMPDCDHDGIPKECCSNEIQLFTVNSDKCGVELDNSNNNSPEQTVVYSNSYSNFIFDQIIKNRDKLFKSGTLRKIEHGIYLRVQSFLL